MNYYLETPSMDRRLEALEYLNEFDLYNSGINGSCGLDRYRDNYERWLERLEYIRNVSPSEEVVPALTYFMIEEETNQIVGMVNIRLSLNERLRNFGGNIGYSIRPLRRREGLAKIQLYLALQVLANYGVDVAYLGAVATNEGSIRTILSLGGELLYQGIDPDDNLLSNAYAINISESLERYANLYSQRER